MPILSTAEKPERASHDGATKRRNHTRRDAVKTMESLRQASTVSVGGDALSIPAVSAALCSITEVTPDAETRGKMENALRALRDDIRKLTGTLGEINERYVEDIDVRAKPTEQELATEIEIGEEPLGVSVVGSFLLNLWRDHSDIAVRVPEGYFGDRDVGNFKYHRKRVLLLAHIRKHLETLEWDVSFQGTGYKPVLCAKKKEDDDDGECKEGPTVRIHLMWTEVFPPRYLAPDRRNVREKGELSEVDDDKLATPAYNASIAIDGAYMTHLRLSHAAKDAAPAFGSAVRLLAAWCIRRRLLFGGSIFVPTVLLADSIVNHGAPVTANDTHLFRFALTRISAGVLENLECGGVRVCGLFDKALLQRAKLEAKAALVIIDAPCAVVDPWKGALSGLFHTARGGMNKSVPLSSLFDAFVHVKAESAAGETHLRSVGKVAAILRDALLMTKRAAWVEEISDGVFGIVLRKPVDAVLKVDRCPDDVTDEKFKEFWGGKVELRRFANADIKLCMVWSGGPDTLETMTKYAFKRHLGDDVSVDFVFQIEEAAGIKRGEKEEKETMRMHSALHELGKTMRALEDLPLRVTSVTGASAHLRRAAVQSARPQPKGKFIEPIECIAEFESSRSWPKDAVAISASKAAFYVALHGSLKKEKGIESQATISFVDVFLSGFVFRIRIHVEAEKDCFREDSRDREILVWQTKGRLRIHNELRMHPLAETSAAVSRLVKRWLSAHMLFAYMGDRREEFVELLVARALEGPSARPVNSVLCGFAQVLHLICEYPWETSPLMVSPSTEKDDYDDDEEKEADNINAFEDRRNEEQITEALRKFEFLNRGKPGMGVIFDDGEPFRWFQKSNTPEYEIVERLIATAKASLEHLENVVHGKVGREGLETLFRTTKDGVFQIALKIKSEAAPRVSKKGGKKMFQLANSMVGFNPIERLRASLAEELGDMALFLHDTFGGKVIYVVWKKNALKKEKPFAISNMRFRIPDAKKNVLLPDRAGILEEISRLGFGIISSVQHMMEDELF